MSKPDLTIRSVTARAVDVPISRPVKNAFGVTRSAPLMLIECHDRSGGLPGIPISLATPG